MRILYRRIRVLCALLLAAALPACGGGGTTTGSTAMPTPTPSLAPFLLFQAAFPPLAPGDFAVGDFAINASGTVRGTMDWTFPANQMFFFIMAGTTCSPDDFVTFITSGPVATCTMLGSDLDPSSKPAVITFSVTQGANARVFVLNLGPGDESGVVQITLTR